MVTSDASLFSQNAYVNINRIMSVASRLAEAGHYASTQIKQISAQLDQDWKSFAAALDERSTILAMSSVFHQKAEQVRRQEVPSFTRGSFLPVASRSATMSRRSARFISIIDRTASLLILGRLAWQQLGLIPAPPRQIKVTLDIGLIVK